jgi:AraC-like DNA-binding protein
LCPDGTGAKVADYWSLEVLLMPLNKIAKGSRSISPDYLVYLRDFALSKGITAKTLIKNSNADLQLLLDPPKQVSEQTFQQMGANLFNALENPYAGVIEFGKGMLLSLHGSLGVAIQGAHDLYEVAQLAQKYYQTRANSRSLQLIESATHYYLRYSEDAGDYDNYFPLATLISFEYVVTNLLNHYNLQDDCVIHQTMSEPDNFPWTLLQGYQIKFNQTHNQILLPLKWMKLPIRPIDPELAKLAQKQCEQTMQALSPQDLISEIRHQLKMNDNHNLGLKQMAERLHVSPSTLQRRLREFDTTFKNIKLEQRLIEAKQLLLNHQYTLEQISEQLHFCDASSFTKSFKTFTGTTPSAYRQQHAKVTSI